MAENDPLGLSNLKHLSEPMKLLIEKVSQGVGGLYRPIQIRRMAAARGYAEVVRARTAKEVMTIEDKASGRLLEAEARKQGNIEKVVAKALPNVASDAQPKEIDDDWLVYFFEKASLFSDNEMQALWAKILAGEANVPGTFSRRTLNALAVLEAEEAKFFTSLSGFVWNIDGSDAPLIFDPYNNIYKEQDVVFGYLTRLDAIGLITFSPVEGFALKAEGRVRVAYHGERLFLSSPEDKPNLDIGKVVFTGIGEELYKICQPATPEGYKEYVLAYWKGQGVKITPA